MVSLSLPFSASPLSLQFLAEVASSEASADFAIADFLRHYRILLISSPTTLSIHLSRFARRLE